MYRYLAINILLIINYPLINNIIVLYLLILLFIYTTNQLDIFEITRHRVKIVLLNNF